MNSPYVSSSVRLPSELHSLSIDTAEKRRDEATRKRIRQEDNAAIDAQKTSAFNASLMSNMEIVKGQEWVPCSEFESLEWRSPVKQNSCAISLPTRGKSPIAFADSFLPSFLFEHLAEVANAVVLYRTGKGQTPKITFRVNWKHVRLVFFHRILFSLVRLKKIVHHFDSAKEMMKRGETPPFNLMNRYQFECLNPNVFFTFREMQSDKTLFAHLDMFYSKVRHIMWNSVRPGNTFAFDELVIPYEGKTPLATFLPRKPHKIGLLMYLLSSETSKGYPFVVDFVPNDRTPKVDGSSALMNVFTRVSQMECFSNIRPHFFVDAAFGGIETVERGAALNFFVTASVNQAHRKPLVSILGFQMTKKQYRFAHKTFANGWCVSVLVFFDNDSVIVCSNALLCKHHFNPLSVSSSTSDPSYSSSSSSSSSSTSSQSQNVSPLTPSPSPRTLNSFGFTPKDAIDLAALGANNPHLLQLISNRFGVNVDEVGGGYLNLVQNLTNVPIEQLSKRAAVGNTSGPSYHSMSARQLAAVCKQRGLKPAGKKDTLVRRLEFSDNNAVNDVPQLVHDFVGPVNTGTPCEEVASFHQYREHFNSVDKFDRHFYSILFKHGHKDPIMVVVWSLLQILFVNSWIFYRESVRDIALQEYARNCVEDVLNNEK